MWVPWARPGLEHLRLELDPDGPVADGLVLGLADERAFRLYYRIQCDSAWRVQRADLALLGADRPPLNLRTDGEGRWTDGDGRPLSEFEGCLDLDLSVTPFTNTLPIRRLGLEPGQSAEVLMAYVDVPELRLQSTRQRYDCLEMGPGGGMYRFTALPGGYNAVLPVDPDGLVLDYRGLFKRVWST